jgi:hypothetical protein
MKRLFIIGLLTGCFHLVFAQRDKKDDFNLPPDFSSKESVILIAPGSSDKITESMEEIFEKNYTGKFEMSASKKSPVSKYPDETAVYLFMVTEKMSPGYSVGRDRFPPTTDYKFGLTDLRTGKSYYQDFWSGSYKQGGKQYVKKLEARRKKD